MLNHKWNPVPEFNALTESVRREIRNLDTPTWQVHDKTMGLVAYIQDEVVDTGEGPSEIMRLSLEPYLNFILRCPETYSNGQNRVEVLWRTMIWDLRLTAKQVCSPASDECGASFRSWLASNIVIGIQSAMCGGKRRSECLREMRNLVALAMTDTTGTIPRLSEIRAICKDSGVLEGGLVAEADVESFEPSGSIFLDTSPSAFHTLSTISFEADHRIHRTRKGYIGLGPFSTSRGDKVVIAAEKRVPLILRPSEHSYLSHRIPEPPWVPNHMPPRSKLQSFYCPQS
jgi:hypothetical protein